MAFLFAQKNTNRCDIRNTTWRKTMTKEEALTMIREAAEKLGHTPSFGQLEQMTPLRRRAIRRLFGSYTWALQEAGLGYRYNANLYSTDDLFAEWAMVARKLNKIPSIKEFEEQSKFTVGPYQRRFRHWSQVPRGMADYARKHAVESEWPDVMAMIREREDGRAAPLVKWPVNKVGPVPIRRDRPVYGPAMAPAAFVHEPINEMGVVFLFGTQAARLGFMVTHVQAEFPDCEAFVEVAPKRLQRILIEFELESRNFLKHDHRVDECDMIVCWEHNWPGCPLEVVELKSVMANASAELDREIGKVKSRNLPLINTDDADRKSGDQVIENQEGLSRMEADEKPGP